MVAPHSVHRTIDYQAGTSQMSTRQALEVAPTAVRAASFPCAFIAREQPIVNQKRLLGKVTSSDGIW
jgi:hypothetical protein